MNEIGRATLQHVTVQLLESHGKRYVSVVTGECLGFGGTLLMTEEDARRVMSGLTLLLPPE